jgi:hypothetical protein
MSPRSPLHCVCVCVWRLVNETDGTDVGWTLYGCTDGQRRATSPQVGTIGPLPRLLLRCYANSEIVMRKKS